MLLQKVISKKTLNIKKILLPPGRSLTKISGAESGSVSRRCGSAALLFVMYYDVYTVVKKCVMGRRVWSSGKHLIPSLKMSSPTSISLSAWGLKRLSKKYGTENILGLVSKFTEASKWWLFTCRSKLCAPSVGIGRSNVNDIGTEAQMFRYRSILSEWKQNVLIWSA